MTILKGYIEEGERPLDAIARIAVLAGQNGFAGYALHCRKCNEPYTDDYDCFCTYLARKRPHTNGREGK